MFDLLTCNICVCVQVCLSNISKLQCFISLLKSVSQWSKKFEWDLLLKDFMPELTAK